MATAAETAAAPGVGSVHGSTKTLLDRLMDDMESLGIVTELAGKVGGRCVRAKQDFVLVQLVCTARCLMLCLMLMKAHGCGA